MSENECTNNKICDIKHESLEKLIQLSDLVLETRLDGMDTALKVHAKEMERRLERLNELREEVIRDRSQFVNREGYEARLILIDKDINTLNKFISDTTFNLNKLITDSIIVRNSKIEESAVDYNKKINDTNTRISIIETKYNTWIVVLGIVLTILGVVLRFIKF